MDTISGATDFLRLCRGPKDTSGPLISTRSQACCFELRKPLYEYDDDDDDDDNNNNNNNRNSGRADDNPPYVVTQCDWVIESHYSYYV